jgi:hypothetical protein
MCKNATFRLPKLKLTLHLVPEAFVVILKLLFVNIYYIKFKLTTKINS